MNVDINKMRNTAKLARLIFDDSELEALRGDFDTILDYMDIVSKFDSKPIESKSVHRSTPLREDRSDESLQIEDALQNAPDSDSNYFRVPQVIEN